MAIKQDQEKENWQFEGYVIDYKKDMQGGHQYLMAWGVEAASMNNHTVDQILKTADPDAMWISIPEATAKNIQLGDKIKVKTTGTINDSFPSQAAAERVEVDKSVKKLNIS